MLFRNHAKERSEPKNSHFEEIINDLFFYLNKYGSFFGSQRELREELEATTGFEVKERSLKEVIKQLKTDAYQDKIKIEILGRGRGSRTKITLISDNKDNNKQGENVVHYVPQLGYKNQKTLSKKQKNQEMRYIVQIKLCQCIGHCLARKKEWCKLPINIMSGW